MDKEIQRKCGNVCSQAAAYCNFRSGTNPDNIYHCVFYTSHFPVQPARKNCIDYPYLDIISRFPRRLHLDVPCDAADLGLPGADRRDPSNGCS